MGQTHQTHEGDLSLIVRWFSKAIMRCINIIILDKHGIQEGANLL